jgi:hypothetical protein
MHSLSTSFLLGYHGCDRETGERLLLNEAFLPSDNGYDWLGSGIYFWESNPDRALEWAHRHVERKRSANHSQEPFVVGAVIDPGYCLDLISSNGASALAKAYPSYETFMETSGTSIPVNTGGTHYLHRKLDCAVINFVHLIRKTTNQPAFDTVRGVFMEGERIYPSSGFRRQTHIQICVRNPKCIKGVFRVPQDHFTA